MKQCGRCGHSASGADIFCTMCGERLSPRGKSKWKAAILALILGLFGAHADYLDNPSMALMIRRINLCSLITGLVGAAGSILIFPITLVLLSAAEFALMEAVILLQAALYVTASEERFQHRYVVDKKWL